MKDNEKLKALEEVLKDQIDYHDTLRGTLQHYAGLCYISICLSGLAFGAVVGLVIAKFV